VTSFFGFKGAFLHFSCKRPDRSALNFFSGFRRKHLLITTCIEKQCTRPLKLVGFKIVIGNLQFQIFQIRILIQIQNRNSFHVIGTKLKKKLSLAIDKFSSFAIFFSLHYIQNCISNAPSLHWAKHCAPFFYSVLRCM